MQQVGKAAIIGWRDVIAPALSGASSEIGIWPFHGNLRPLLARKDLVIAEAYPAEACITLGLTSPGRGWSKRKQKDRKARAERILSWSDWRGVSLVRDLRELLAGGFPDAVGEDQFDSLLGAMAAIEVLARDEEAFVPDSRVIRAVEGWILGQGPIAGPE